MKKLLLWLTVAAMLLCVTACGEKDTDKTGTTTQKRADGKPSAQKVGTVYADEKDGFQLDAPQKGDTVAIMHTTMGDISIRFFPEAAPKTVENFLTHAKDGYYDGLLFHRVINDFMIQGGDPLGTGTGGESIWGGKFEDEFDSKLHNIRGSLAMANSGANTNGSQFFINQARPASFNRANYDYDSTVAMYKNYYEQGYKDRYATFEEFVEQAAGGINPLSYTVPEEVWELYEKTGGNINLDGAYREKAGHTVFGQVYDGMDVVDNIAAVITNSSDRPITPVVINSIEVTEYAG